MARRNTGWINQDATAKKERRWAHTFVGCPVLSEIPEASRQKVRLSDRPGYTECSTCTKLRIEAHYEKQFKKTLKLAKEKLRSSKDHITVVFGTGSPVPRRLTDLGFTVYGGARLFHSGAMFFTVKWEQELSLQQMDLSAILGEPV